jgi:GntR family transcriptional repressor for pyruvate dehydrogenase complex
MSRLHRTAMRDLIGEIVAGDLAPGDMLPKEVALAERFEVSRGVARECIRGLEERGLVRVKHGRGATVTEPAEWDVFDSEVLAAVLASPRGDELLVEAIECQRLLEVEAAGLAAQRAEHADLDALTHAVERMAEAMRRPRSAEQAQAADLDFHRAVVRASGNRAIARMSELLHRALGNAGGPRGSTSEIQAGLADHRRILAAIAARDAAEARAAVAEHLAAGARRLRRRASSRD